MKQLLSEALVTLAVVAIVMAFGSAAYWLGTVLQ